MWKQYMWEHNEQDEVVRVLMPAEYKGNPWSFFIISKGSSWHGKDAQTIFWMGKHWFFLTVSGFLIAGVVGGALWWLWSMWVMETGKTSRGRTKGFSFWRRLSSKDRYELVDRMA
jgi:mannosyltransferase OCH1-like enzyme